jgi:hypothetical protein
MMKNVSISVIKFQFAFYFDFELIVNYGLNFLMKFGLIWIMDENNVCLKSKCTKCIIVGLFEDVQIEDKWPSNFVLMVKLIMRIFK